MFTYKIDIIEELRLRGFTQTYIKNNNLISQSSMTCIRKNQPISLKTLNDICIMLDLPLDQVIDFTITEEERIKFSKPN